MLGFIFGLMVGVAASGPSSPGQGVGMALLSQIPLRCYAAYDEGPEAYRLCRGPSLAGELDANTRPLGNGGRSLCESAWTGGQIGKGWVDACDRTRHLAWEMAALDKLKAQAAANGQGH